MQQLTVPACLCLCTLSLSAAFERNCPFNRGSVLLMLGALCRSSRHNQLWTGESDRRERHRPADRAAPLRGGELRHPDRANTPNPGHRARLCLGDCSDHRSSVDLFHLRDYSITRAPCLHRSSVEVIRRLVRTNNMLADGSD